MGKLFGRRVCTGMANPDGQDMEKIFPHRFVICDQLGGDAEWIHGRVA